METNPRLVGVILAALMLGGCNGDGDAWGSLSLGVTDAPVDSASRVLVEVTGVELVHQDGTVETFAFDAPRRIDLLSLQGGAAELLLDAVAVPAGHYESVRLSVNAARTGSSSFIEYEDGSVHPLFVPSGSEAGLRLVSGFDVPAGGAADFTIDFDLRRAVVRPPGLAPDHILRPALRLVDNTEIGSIAGRVAESLVFPADASDCTAAVYVFSGANVEPTDVAGEAGPLLTAAVALEEPTGEYRYRAAFLAVGDYTVAFTCDAEDDLADSEDGIGFVGGTKSVTVVAGGESVVNFPAD